MNQPETPIKIFERKIKFLSLAELSVITLGRLVDSTVSNDDLTRAYQLVEIEINNRISKLFEL